VARSGGTAIAFHTAIGNGQQDARSTRDRAVGGFERFSLRSHFHAADFDLHPPYTSAMSMSL
jgi:hypothetical protein